jgi:hypothetical protein
MIQEIQQSLIVGLLFWAFLSLGAALVGLYARPGEFWRGLWFMSGLWGLIDGLIAWSGLLVKAGSVGELRGLLRLNAGLDVLYLLIGVILWRRERPELCGFGLAVLAQGAFLLLFDGAFWWRCELASR